MGCSLSGHEGRIVPGVVYRSESHMRVYTSHRRKRGAGASVWRRSNICCSYRLRPPSARGLTSSSVWYVQTARNRSKHATECTTVNTRRGRGTSIQYASGGFQDNPGFEYHQVLHLYITLVLMLAGMGMAANIQMTFRYLGMDVHVYTIIRTLEHYSGVAGKHIRTIKSPCVGNKWVVTRSIRRSAAKSRVWLPSCILPPSLC